MNSEVFWGSNMTETSSSSGDDTESSCSEGSESSLRLEEVNVCGAQLQLPQGLCENGGAFNEILSVETWNQLSEQHRQHLMNFLPSFPENDRGEKEQTLQRLFTGENFKFGNPVSEFFKQLKAGNFRPDIRSMRKLLRRAQYREYKNQQKRYYYTMMKAILVGRVKLLEAASNGSPGAVPRPEKLPSSAPRPSPVQQRVRRRYFQELTSVREELGETSQSSEDENYPEGPPASLNKKVKRQITLLENSLSSDLHPITSTLANKPNGLDLEQKVTASHNPYEITEDVYREMLVRHRKRRRRKEEHPDLQTKGITANEVLNRCQLKKLSSRDLKPLAKKQKLKPSLTESLLNFEILDNDGSSSSDDGDMDKVDVEGDDDPFTFPNPPTSTPSVFRSLTTAVSSPSLSSSLLSKPSTSGKFLTTTPTRKIKVELPEEPPPPLTIPHPIPTPAPVVQAPLPPPPPPRTPPPPPAPPSPPPPPPPPPVVTRPHPVPKPQPHPVAIILPKPPQTIVTSRVMTPATLSDLDGIDMMDLPVDLEESEITFSPEDIKPELMQETHACFFSLLRDIICSTPEHRMSLLTLEDRVKSWAVSPISPLNEWYTAATAETTGYLHSALSFLCGEYPEWQPDEFVPYMEYKVALDSYQWIGAGRDTDTHLVALCRVWTERRDDMVARPVKEEEECVSLLTTRDRLLAASPPPPRCPTQWLVRQSTHEERESFREQERVRYENPHKAFTFRMHGYESVVGPVKGMYFQAMGNNKPRGHSLLTETRPNFITILALVRDATARLPNGQGTRAEICMLLKDSQYLIEQAPDSDLHSVVSGALDRLHYEPDPCVKYDGKRKIWIYLHRARTEQEFERIHQEQQKVVRPKNPRKAHRAKVQAAVSALTHGSVEVKVDTPVKAATKRASKAAAKPAKAAAKSASAPPPPPPAKAAAKSAPAPPPPTPVTQPEQHSWLQLQTVDNSQILPEISSVEVKTEQIESLVTTSAPSAPTPVALLSSVVPMQTATAQVPKSLIASTSLAPAKKSNTPAKTLLTKSVTTVKTIPPKQEPPSVEVNKSILVKNSRQKVAVTKAKTVKATKEPSLSVVRRIPETQVSVESAVRRIVDNVVPPAMQTVVKRVAETARTKKDSSLMEFSGSSVIAKKKVVQNATTQVVNTTSKTSAQSLVKMITTQAGVRTVQTTGQMNPQQVMLIKQGQQTYLAETTTASAKPSQQQQQTMQGQQLIVMKQPGEAQASTSQPQMIVINQQQIMTDQQLSVKQQKQLQQLLSKQQYIEQSTMGIQQQQLQQLLLAKQQQLIEQQKSGKVAQQQQQQMIVVKQQTVSHQNQSEQKPQPMQQMILVKQQQQQNQQTMQQHVITTETQQITQQQLQLLIKQQQLQQSQAATSVPQQLKGQIQTQTISLAQLQQLQQQQLQQQHQQQQQQRIVSSASLLNPRVVVSQGGSSSGSQSVQVQASTLLKSQPMVAKVVTNAQGQPVISMESLLAHQKQMSTVPQTLRVATASSKSGVQPQYTVVSVAQPRVIQASQMSQVSAAGTVSATVVTAAAGAKATTHVTATTANLRMSGINLAQLSGIGGKPVLLASKPQSIQTQNVLVASQGGGQTVLLAPQGLNPASLRAQAPLTVLQQGTQQILLPPGFHASALNIKGLQGLKVIPITASSPQSKGVPGRQQQVYARIINPGTMRPSVVASLVQSDQVQPSNPPSTS